MTPELYRIESASPIIHRFLRMTEPPRTFSDASLAVAIAAKCVPNAAGSEVRVVHIPSGNIIFRKEGGRPSPADEI